MVEFAKSVFVVTLVAGFLYFDDQKPLLPDDIYCMVGAGTKVLKHIDPIMKPGCQRVMGDLKSIDLSPCIDDGAMTTVCRHGSLWAGAAKLAAIPAGASPADIGVQSMS
jgi:hypothetical protein